MYSWNRKLFLLICLAVTCAGKIFSQQNHALITDTVGFHNPDSIKQIVTPEASKRISLSNYFLLLGDDLEQDLISPFHQSGKSWKNIGIYAASLTTFSLAFDEAVQRSASSIRDHNKAVASVSNFVTKFGGSYGIYTLGTLGVYGFLFHNSKMQTTTLLATQAYITSGLLETGLKYITGRQRPSYYSPQDDDPEPEFHGPSFSFGNNIYKKGISTAFPSGHTTVAFAVATVFAKEYKNKPWIPITAYSAASLVGLSRVTQNSHWITDVIVGATLGYLCGVQVVHNYHHYADLNESRQKHGVLSFNLRYNGYNAEPGLIYTFRH